MQGDRLGGEYAREKELTLRGMQLGNAKATQRGLTLSRVAEAVSRMEGTFGARLGAFPVDHLAAVVRRVIFGLELTATARDPGSRF